MITYSVLNIIAKTTEYLKKKGIENARLNAEMLVGFVLNLDRIQLYLNFERLVQQPEIDKLKALLIRRAAHEPIQYLTGASEFYSLTFKVNQHTFIPRPETEILIDVALKICNAKFANQDKIEVLDIGTGCGNIAIALAKNNKRVYVTALDIELGALEIAKENSARHSVSEQINFWHQNIFENFPAEFPQFDIIVSNPPYISKTEMENLPLEVKNFEPHIALAGGEVGLKYYLRISDLVFLLKKNGVIIVEIGATQAKQATDVFSHEKGFKQVHIFKDLNKLDRVVLIES